MKAKFKRLPLLLSIISLVSFFSYTQENFAKKEISTLSDNYYLNLGILAAESNKPDSAIVYITKAIELNKKNPISYYVRASVYYELNRYDEALRDLNQSIKINSKDEKSLYLRAVIYQNKSSYTNAAKDYEALLKLNSNDSNYYFQSAYCLQELNEYQKSLENYLKFEKLAKLPPEEFYINIIYNFIQLKKYQEALIYVEKSEKSNYSSIELIQLKLNILTNNSKCDDAMKLIEANFNSIDNKSNTLTNIGMCFLRNKKYAEAAKALSRAYELDKSLVENLFNLAYISQQTNNPTQMMNYLEQFINESKNRNDLVKLRDEALKQLNSMKK